jgi:hypothetical protein
VPRSGLRLTLASVAVGAHRLGRLEREVPGEHGEPGEEGPFAWGQRRVAPVDRGPQRPLARRGRAAAGGEQREAVGEAVGDLFRRERPDPRRRQLDGEGETVEAPADPVDGGGGFGRQGEVRPPGAGAGHEQAHGLARSVCGGRRRRAAPGGRRRGREGKGWHRPEALASEAERLAAGRQDAHVGARAQESIREGGAGGQQALTVVQHQQHPLAAQRFGQREQQRLPAFLLHAHDAGDDPGNR